MKISGKFLQILLCLICVGCLNKITIAKKKKISVSNGLVILNSVNPTNNSTATIEISCLEGSTHYIESATIPLADDVGWMTCQSFTSFLVTPPLINGVNNFKYWFKNDIDNIISSISTDIEIVKCFGPRFTRHLV